MIVVELVTTVLEIFGFALVIAGVGVVTAVMVQGALGVGLGLSASGVTCLGLSMLLLGAQGAIKRGRRTK